MTNHQLLVTHFKKSKNKLSDSINYIYSHYRYRLYYSETFGHLMRPHIREQIDFRIQVMNKDCYTSGSCKHCGCTTTHLQMSNRMCEGKEYPPILDKDHWDMFSKGRCRVGHLETHVTWMLIVTKHSTTLITTYNKPTKHVREVQLNTPLHISITAK